MNPTEVISLKSEQAAECNQIEQGSTQEFRSTGQDPHWVWSGLLLTSGWYKFTAHIQLSSEYTTPHKCYFASGRTFTEQQSARFEQVDDNLHIAYLFLPDRCTDIRYDPMETVGAISFIGMEVEACERDSVPEKFLTQEERAQPSSIVDKIKSCKAYPYLNQLLHKMPFVRSLILKCLAPIHAKAQIEHYDEWLKVNEHIPSLEYQKVQSDKLQVKPLFSIIMPTYNTDPVLLEECIESVLNQGYENWELCIADDASTNSLTKDALLRYAEQDSRIKVTFRELNGHICQASNDALSLATGDWITLLDHDDLLASHALLSMAKAINANPSADIFYSDEDKISVDGMRSDPHLKPQWSKDLLYSHNYISHLGVYRKEIINEVGGFRVGFEGSQDYDLLLRCIKHIESRLTFGELKHKIIHIPHILYHWRVLEGSTALNEEQKDYSQNAGLKALQDALPNTLVEKGELPNTYKVNWPIPADEPLVSLIIPTKNGQDLVKQCIESIEEKTSYSNWEILLVDNQSDKPDDIAYFEQLAADQRIQLLNYDKPFNYSAINNYAIEYAKGSIVVLLNNDVEVINPEWLTEMVSLCLRGDVGCVGAKLYYPNNTLQHAGVVLGLGGVAGHSHKYFDKQHDGYFKRLKIRQNLSAVTAACLAVRKEVYLQVGGLNETDLTVAFNDVDFCLKVHTAGYKNIWTPYAELYHHESISRGTENTPEKQARFGAEIDYMKRIWRNELLNDPYYHPLLTRDREDFSKR
ncbi:glycosyltransferase family 2 protein [Vibrio nereis]|uniref:glycosyltransferase family 2 protein n=1 Tax=Vibrio nereis TaxID=693 RepID=UPI002495249F|nr:glycosyltransferase family 2 protein [Vibrio nereis]